MTPTSNRLARRVALAVLAIALPASAIQPPVRARVKPRIPVSADAPRTRADAVAGPEALDALAPDARTSLAGMGWDALTDRSTGRPLRAWGAPVPAASALAFLDARPSLLGFRRGQGGYELLAREPFRVGSVTVTRFEQRWHGFPVEGVHADVRSVDAGVVMTRLHLARGITAATSPVISADAALAGARAFVVESGRTPSGMPVLAAEPLVVVRRADEWRLAWAVRTESVAPAGRLTVWIDALDGKGIAIRDEIRRGAVDTPLTLEVSYEPRRAGDQEVIGRLPFFHARDGAETFVTDTSGVATIPVGGASRSLDLSLEGDYTKIVLWEGSSSAAVAVDAGVPETFTWDAQSASLSERDAAYSHAVVRERMLLLAPDLEFLETQVGIQVDVPDSDGCNAYWDGNSAQFFAESEVCNATARIADVVYHELGHGFHGALAGGIPPASVGEGSADYLAATITGDPDIAPSFYKDQPQGLRNLEPDLVFPDDIEGESHHDGLIWGGALWDMRTALIASLGTGAGIARADAIFTDALRFNPVMDDGFYDVLLAADDDANIQNGGPHECEIVDAFGAHGLGPGDGLAIAHRPLDVQPPGGGGFTVRAHIGSAFPRCGATGLTAATLEWRRAGESGWREVAMGADLVPGWRSATIPPQAEGTVVEYRMRALGGSGGVALAPARFFDEDPFRFRIGADEVVFEDDFETDREWTHALLDGNDILGADDWQRGTPRGRSGDPHYAWSGENVWGNDLGEDPFNGAYQPGIHNRLESPVIDCRECGGTRLLFRRWLGAEASTFDVASVWIDDERVWTNTSAGRVRDGEWRLEDLDISRVADGKKFRIRFEMQSDAGVELGGWNVDDVRVTRSGRYDGGACSCALGSETRPRTSWLAMLVVAAALVARRRRATRR